MITEIFQEVLYIPLFNFLVWLYNVLPGHDIGAAIIILTAVIRLLLYPLMSSSIRAQKSLKDLQPKMEKIKEEFKNNKEAQAREIMKLYKENKVNPASSCLPVLIQIPILLAFYWVLRDGLATSDFSKLYSFVQNPGSSLDPVSFGLMNLKEPSYVLAILAGAAQFIQTKMIMAPFPPKESGEGGKDESMMSMMNKQMLYFMPIITVIIGAKLPGGLTLYWFVSTVFTALQQIPIMKAKYADGEAKKSQG